ncbi:MAG: glycoside hydrolase family 3 C-terminal domain-containing protein, partial [Deltaproteobacteria bacterium]|nr:glycoside hydrolase family 3 C-terminal domain-containing protein [Deltaproteobacteria bacterium]
DVAVVVVGESQYAEWRGDRDDLHLYAEDIAAIDSVKKSGIPFVVVLFSGRSMIITDELEKADSWIAAWLPGTEGEGIADVLFGDVKPTGKLSHSWPKNMNQIPINYGDSNYTPLFPLGYGLTY